MVRRFPLVIIVLGFLAAMLGSSASAQGDGKRLITVYDRGLVSVFMTDAKTLKQALADNDYTFDSRDTVEPSLSEELVAPSYNVNIYRSRPVVVIDGDTRSKIVTAYQTPRQIARDAKVTVYDEDISTIQRSTDYLNDGAGLQLVITRAVPLELDLYGSKNIIRTQGKTVGAMLKEKKIKLSDQDRVTPSLDTVISEGLAVRVWREGIQAVTINEAIQFDVEQVYDADREIGYRLVKTEGQLGVRSVTYEIEIKDGVELSRKKIAQLDTKNPQKEVVVIGVKPGPNSLTRSKGAHHFIDSRGISHRETYYDLDMGRVMQACGQGGYYTVRTDGVKVDSQGYVIIAANLNRYPRCSVVETSLGLGKVYDTGGFALVHPEGFDLATDWTNNNGR